MQSRNKPREERDGSYDGKVTADREEREEERRRGGEEERRRGGCRAD